MTCVVVVLPEMRGTIFINKKHVKYNPYVLDDVMWNLMRNETERVETELTDECKWNLTVGESRFKLYTNQTKNK